jgi:hypothetical protein
MATTVPPWLKMIVFLTVSSGPGDPQSLTMALVTYTPTMRLAKKPATI